MVTIKGIVTERFNPYREIVEILGKEDMSTEYSTPPMGATSIREWKDKGIILIRRVEWDEDKGMFVMKDEASIPKKYPELIRKLREVV